MLSALNPSADCEHEYRLDAVAVNGVVHVGRGAGSGIRLDSEALPLLISRRHATLVLSAGHVSVSDLGSTNGTFICRSGGSFRQLPSGTHAQLQPGDVVAFGGSNSVSVRDGAHEGNSQTRMVPNPFMFKFSVLEASAAAAADAEEEVAETDAHEEEANWVSGCRVSPVIQRSWFFCFLTVRCRRPFIRVAPHTGRGYPGRTACRRSGKAPQRAAASPCQRGHAALAVAEEEARGKAEEGCGFLRAIRAWQISG